MQFFKVKKKITISIKDSRSCFDKTIINNSFCGFLTPLNKKKKKHACIIIKERHKEKGAKSNLCYVLNFKSILAWQNQTVKTKKKEKNKVGNINYLCLE